MTDMDAVATKSRDIDWDGAKAPSLEAFEVMAQAAFDRLPEEFRALFADVVFNVTRRELGFLGRPYCMAFCRTMPEKRASWAALARKMSCFSR